MKNLHLLAVGHAVPDVLSVLWTVHDGGLRGSHTTIIRSDLLLSEVTFDASMPLDRQLPKQDLGHITPEAFQELATVLVENQVEQIPPGRPATPGSASVSLMLHCNSEQLERSVNSALISSVPAMKAVEVTVARLRSAFPKS